MKLDRIKFATLIGYCANRGMTVYEADVDALDQLTEINVEPVEVPKTNPAKINELMRAIHAGEKIAAIKLYRDMTGYGLKESKDAVEEHWTNKKTELCNVMIKSINNQLSDEFNSDQLKLVKEFINSFY